jgi:hypothetical protein
MSVLCLPSGAGEAPVRHAGRKGLSKVAVLAYERRGLGRWPLVRRGHGWTAPGNGEIPPDR